MKQIAIYAKHIGININVCLILHLNIYNTCIFLTIMSCIVRNKSKDFLLFVHDAERTEVEKNNMDLNKCLVTLR